MHEYGFKIKKGDLEFEFSTTDKNAFEEQLSDWIRGVMKSESPIVEAPVNEENIPQRKGFIEVKELVKINEIQSPEPKMEENFEEILEESIQNPKTEVIEKTEVMTPFKAYLSAFLPKNSTDYLVLTAKFLADNENVHNFFIKQLNAKLVPAIGKPIDHNDVHEAIEAGVLAEVPNYTDVSDVKEYTLTEAGENYAVEQ